MSMSRLSAMTGTVLVAALIASCGEAPTAFDEGPGLSPDVTPAFEGTEGSVDFGLQSVDDQPGIAVALTPSASFEWVDYASFGVGAMRNVGSGDITVAGISGHVRRAYLIWQGPTNSADPMANGYVFVNGYPVEGRNIGFSDDACWGFSNSQAYVGNVTGLVRAMGNGTYQLTGFGAGATNTNGASLAIFYDDAVTANNRHVYLFLGNDGNIPSSYDGLGWNALLTGIGEGSLPGNLQLHVADGQTFVDNELIINGTVKIPTSNWVTGFSVPGASNGPTGNGRLWDIVDIDVSADLEAVGPAPKTLHVETGLSSDCLNLVAAVVEVRAK